jgi:Tfp pilus assembly PilM family ATPase
MAKSGLGVTVGSHSLRAVAVVKKGAQWAVTRAFSQRLEESLRDEAGRLLASKGLRGQAATLGLSGRDVIIRYNQVPPVPDWRLRNLMKFEVMEVSGQSGGEVSADYRKLNLPDPEGTRGEDTVLVCLCNAYLKPLMASLEGAGLKVTGGCPRSVALFSAFAVNATYREDETCLLVHVGAAGLDMALQRGGELLFARNATPGGLAFTQAVASAFSTPESKAETLKLTKGDVTPRAQARYADPTAEKVANAMVATAGQVAQLIQSTLMIGRAQTKLASTWKVDRVLPRRRRLAEGPRRVPEAQAMGVPVERFNPFEACDLSGLPTTKQALEAARTSSPRRSASRRCCRSRRRSGSRCCPTRSAASATSRRRASSRSRPPWSPPVGSASCGRRARTRPPRSRARAPSTRARRSGRRTSRTRTWWSWSRPSRRRARSTAGSRSSRSPASSSPTRWRCSTMVRPSYLGETASWRDFRRRLVNAEQRVRAPYTQHEARP